MRQAFIKTLLEIAQQDERVCLLTADLGYSVFEPFALAYPDRYFNVGIAEQNMVGVATGLAKAGFIPYVYSIVTFASLRPFEFIRNGPITHHLPVRIIGMGSGMEYGHNGISHYGLEDLSVMRTQPTLTVIAPADGQQTRSAIKLLHDTKGPIYYSLGKDDRITIPHLNGKFKLDACQTIARGDKAIVFSIGAISMTAYNTVQTLQARGISCSLVIVSTLSPTPYKDILRKLKNFSLAFTIEVQYINGGLGSMIAEIIAENKLPCKLIRCGVRQSPDTLSGSQQSIEKLMGLDTDNLVKLISQEIL